MSVLESSDVLLEQVLKQVITGLFKWQKYTRNQCLSFDTLIVPDSRLLRYWNWKERGRGLLLSPH